MDGVVVIDKPAGMTSHDVVDALRRRLGTRKVGHGGTLDPDATGVLLLGVGRATRFLSFAQAGPKRYEAVVSFGRTTTTLDAAGEVLEERPCSFSKQGLEAALEDFRGEIEQVPPMVSAIKIGGKRLHELARAGKDVDRPPRKVTIHELVLAAFDDGPPPQARIDVRCSGGTYIRTLAADLGESLGCGAHLASLRRTEAGGFGLDESVVLEEVEESSLRPLVDAVRDLDRIEVDDDVAGLVADGRPLPARDDIVDGDAVAVVGSSGLLGVYRRSGDSLKPERVVPR